MNPAILVGAAVVALGAVAAFAIPRRRAAKVPHPVVAELEPEFATASA